MNKYNELIYDKKYVQNALDIKWWELVLLLFVPAVKVENEESVSHYKKMFGKYYFTDFKLKNLK